MKRTKGMIDFKHEIGMRFNGESGETHIDEIKRDNTHVEIL
jgi:hypothetical protein